MIHSDVTTDTISVDSLDCTLSSTVSTTPQITMATNTATHIVDNQNSVAIEKEIGAITMTTTPPALIDASVDLMPTKLRLLLTRSRKNWFSNLFLVMVLVLMPGVGVWLVYLTVTTML